jgi:CRP/FNR family transcriptional regulator, cyclic AMP receptor protein
MMPALHCEPTFSDMFVAYLLARNIRYEEDLVDQHSTPVKTDSPAFSCCCLISAKEGRPETVVPKVSQETLAEMAGTTRSRINLS